MLHMQIALPALPVLAAEHPTGHLAHFKVPKFFYFTSDFPVTVTGKVCMVEMCEMAKKILGLQHKR
jgi:fatty-acyl-CoA synthase